MKRLLFLFCLSLFLSTSLQGQGVPYETDSFSVYQDSTGHWRLWTKVLAGNSNTILNRYTVELSSGNTCLVSAYYLIGPGLINSVYIKDILDIDSFAGLVDCVDYRYSQDTNTVNPDYRKNYSFWYPGVIGVGCFAPQSSSTPEQISSRAFIYPSPARHTVQIRDLAAEKILGIVAYSIYGQEIKRWTRGTTLLDISDLPSGWYYLRIRLADHSVVDERILKK